MYSLQLQRPLFVISLSLLILTCRHLSHTRDRENRSHRWTGVQHKAMTWITHDVPCSCIKSYSQTFHKVTLFIPEVFFLKDQRSESAAQKPYSCSFRVFFHLTCWYMYCTIFFSLWFDLDQFSRPMACFYSSAIKTLHQEFLRHRGAHVFLNPATSASHLGWVTTALMIRFTLADRTGTAGASSVSCSSYESLLSKFCRFKKIQILLLQNLNVVTRSVIRALALQI